MAHSVTAIFETSSVGPSPAGWYCSNAGSTLTDSLVDTQVKLANLGRLGACSDGVPVSGQLIVCDDNQGFPADCDFTRSGTMDGATISMANWDATQGTSLGYVNLVYPDGMAVSYTRSNQFDATGPDTNGFVILPDGTIYCAGAASAHLLSGSQTLDTLRDFKRLGTCASITGADTAEGCLGAR